MNDDIVVTVHFETNGLPPGQFWSRGTVTVTAKSRDGVETFTKTRQFLEMEQIPTLIQEGQREYEESRSRAKLED